jgi:hypothetical protein
MRSWTIHSTKKFHSYTKQCSRFMTIASVGKSHIMHLSQYLIQLNFHEIKDCSLHSKISLTHQAMQQVHEKCNCSQFTHTTFTMLDWSHTWVDHVPGLISPCKCGTLQPQVHAAPRRRSKCTALALFTTQAQLPRMHALPHTSCTFLTSLTRISSI